MSDVDGDVVVEESTASVDCVESGTVGRGGMEEEGSEETPLDDGSGSGGIGLTEVLSSGIFPFYY